MNLELERGIFYNKNWDERAGTYLQDVIPDEHTAIKVAVQIFNGMKKNSKMEKYVPQSVFMMKMMKFGLFPFGKKRKLMKC